MKLESVFGEFQYIIEEDLPEIGAYLYCYKSGECISDYLQNSIEDCKDFAQQEFGIAISSWNEIPE